MAECRDHYKEIRAAGASLLAVSVDAPEHSEVLRSELHFPFPILCDTERLVVKDWDVYNAGEKAGIAKPAVFIVNPDRTVRFSSVDSVAMRIPASEIVRLLQTTGDAQPVRRRAHIPTWAELVRGIHNVWNRGRV